jgi:protein SCO1/2
VADFTLTNQLGQSFTLEQLRGRVWVVDIIFTRCAGPCPQMTRQMRQLQLALPQGKPVTLVTLTTDPEFDTPAVLKDYAGRFEAAPADWQFLTGSKTEIFRLAVESLRLSALEVDPAERASPEDLFVHSTLFVIVDQKAQVRGVVEGTEPDAVDKAVGMIERLLRER